MSKEAVDLRKELRAYKYDLNLIQTVRCSEAENKQLRQMAKANEPLPKGIATNGAGNGSRDDYYYRIHKPDFTDDEMNLYLVFTQLKYLKSIKRSLAFFVTITVISLTIVVFWLLYLYA